jgi:site-specific DNA-methyltransferase (adenine-specific)
MADASVDAIVTDPPYCSGGRQSTGERNAISKRRSMDDADWFLGDNMGTETYLWWMRLMAREGLRICTPGSLAYVFTDWRQYPTLVHAWESVGWTLRSVVVWDKGKTGMGSHWRNSHEWAAVFAKGKPRPLPHHSFFNVWSGSKPTGKEHPTEKPVGLMRYLCQSVTPAGGVILDPFCGSGSTGVAAVAEGFRFIGVEREPDFVAISRRRLAAVQPELAA